MSALPRKLWSIVFTTLFACAVGTTPELETSDGRSLDITRDDVEEFCSVTGCVADELVAELSRSDEAVATQGLAGPNAAEGAVRASRRRQDVREIPKIENGLIYSQTVATHDSSDIDRVVKFLYEENWTTWWPNTAVENHLVDGDQVRFVFYPLVLPFGVRPTRLTVEVDRPVESSTADGSRQVRVPLRLAGNFVGPADFVVTEVPATPSRGRHIEMRGSWNGVRPNFAYVPNFRGLSSHVFQRMHLARERAGFLGLLDKLDTPLRASADPHSRNEDPALEELEEDANAIEEPVVDAQ